MHKHHAPQVISMTTREVLTNPQERRSSRRSRRAETLFVQLAAIIEGETQRRTLKCESADLSLGGLRIQVAETLPVGNSVEVWIKLTDSPQTFYLVGSVRWCAPTDHGAEVGIAVTDGPATDFKAWRRMNFAARACQVA